MDPDANLREQRATAKSILAIVDDGNGDGTFTPDQLEALAVNAAKLAELVESLDGWIANLGFLPKRWRE